MLEVVVVDGMVVDVVVEARVVDVVEVAGAGGSVVVEDVVF